MAYGRVNALTVPPEPPPWGDDTPYYWEGEEFVDVTGGWVGYVYGNATTSNEIDHLLIDVLGSSSERQSALFETLIKIDLTNISNLFIEWEITDGGAGWMHFEITELNATQEDRGGSANIPGSLAASFTRNGMGVTGLLTDSIDVTSLTGEYYISVRYRDNTSNSANFGVLKTYKVWGES